jgi:hypothetical protein
MRLELMEHAIAYECRGHVWIFRFSAENDVLIVMTMAGMATDPQSSFTWVDAIRCKELVMNEVGE